MKKLAVVIIITIAVIAGGAALAGGDLLGEPPAAEVPPAPVVPTDPAPAPTPEDPPTPAPAPGDPAAPAPAPEDPAAPAPAPTPDETRDPTPSEPGDALGIGDEGETVRRLQERLAELGYWVGPETDGRFGELTEQAVMAFQKVEGLHRDGIAGAATLAALDTAQRPTAGTESTPGTVVEVDLARQVLFVVRDGSVVEIFNTSTGSGGEWVTRTGRFEVFREVDGTDFGPLGALYRPKYFDGGIAVHGSPEIPGFPASHGCARVHDAVMDHLWDTGALEIHTPVRVY
ncbi:MAG: L,D-transpeptidase family protein [Acidimicrobiales bacterium]